MFWRNKLLNLAPELDSEMIPRQENPASKTVVLGGGIFNFLIRCWIIRFGGLDLLEGTVLEGSGYDRVLSRRKFAVQ